MTRVTYFVTATDTGVGKTVLTAALVRRLVERGQDVAALKPFCSGDRSDAVTIRKSLAGRFALDEINPWYFPSALSPAIAARKLSRSVCGREVIGYIRNVSRRHAVTLVEGAGGLLSPLAQDLDAEGMITTLRAIALVVCPNRLGAINQTLLVMRALPPKAAKKARVILMSQPQRERSAESNTSYLREVLGSTRVFEFPWLRAAMRKGAAPPSAQLRRILDSILRC
ncbi:MAG TPA: dethiobiotin synthase [Verrucomicrobiae bacterium]|nr:dethiobiotin synthase [Verrucomicrobiae bacterium]